MPTFIYRFLDLNIMFVGVQDSDNNYMIEGGIHIDLQECKRIELNNFNNENFYNVKKSNLAKHKFKFYFLSSSSNLTFLESDSEMYNLYNSHINFTFPITDDNMSCVDKLFNALIEYNNNNNNNNNNNHNNNNNNNNNNN